MSDFRGLETGSGEDALVEGLRCLPVDARIPARKGPLPPTCRMLGSARRRGSVTMRSRQPSGVPGCCRSHPRIIR